MEESILNTIKKMLGIQTSVTAFDTDILVNINSAFMVLNQLGVGPEEVYSIEDSTPVWSAFETDITKYQALKSYIFLKVRLTFDPPGTGFHLTAIENQIKELEWRLSVQVPVPPTPTPVVPEEP